MNFVKAWWKKCFHHISLVFWPYLSETHLGIVLAVLVHALYQYSVVFVNSIYSYKYRLFKTHCCPGKLVGIDYCLSYNVQWHKTFIIYMDDSILLIASRIYLLDGCFWGVVEVIMVIEWKFGYPCQSVSCMRSMGQGCSHNQYILMPHRVTHLAGSNQPENLLCLRSSFFL